MFPWEMRQKQIEIELLKIASEKDIAIMKMASEKDIEIMKMASEKDIEIMKMKTERMKTAAYVFVGVLACFSSLVISRSYLVDFKLLVGAICRVSDTIKSLVGAIWRISDTIAGGKLAESLKFGGAVGAGSAAGVAFAYALYMINLRK